jgi:hypothetical protein
MPFVKGDPRINRKGRPRKEAPPVEDAHVEDHAGVHYENEFTRWSMKNEFTLARFHMAIYWPHSWAAIEKLIEHGVIIRHEDESLEWTLNRESLVDLFHEWPWETTFFNVNVKRRLI